MFIDQRDIMYASANSMLRGVSRDLPQQNRDVRERLVSGIGFFTSRCVPCRRNENAGRSVEEVLFVPFRLGVVEMRSEYFQPLAAPGTTERQFGEGGRLEEDEWGEFVFGHGSSFPQRR